MSQSLRCSFLTLLLTLLTVPVVVSSEVIWGTPPPFGDLPPGWKGHCVSRPTELAYCAIWRDGPLQSRLAVIQELHWNLPLALRLYLPNDPPFVLTWIPGFLRYVSLPTYQYGQEFDFFANYILRDPQYPLRLRLERGDTTQDITIPMHGYWQAKSRLSLATKALIERLRSSC